MAGQKSQMHFVNILALTSEQDGRENETFLVLSLLFPSLVLWCQRNLINVFLS